MTPTLHNLHGVIWTEYGGAPQKMGDLELREHQIEFTYTPEYVESGLPGFSLLGDPYFWNGKTVIYPTSERIRFFPRLMSLVPGNNPRNLQRRHLLDLLRRQDRKEPPENLYTEWRLLTSGGHGSIGHVDVFADDLAAKEWYQRHDHSLVRPHTNANGDRSEIWKMLKRDVLDEHIDVDPQVIDEVLGPTPTVNGMVSKLLPKSEHRTVIWCPAT